MFPPNLPLLEEVTRTWRRGEEIRARRRRLMQHTYGDQWSDWTFTAEGLPVTEYDKAVMSGMRPLTNNLLRALVKSVVGRFRFNVSQAPQTADAALRDFHSANFISELDARALEEYLISGCAIQKIVCEARPGCGMGVWTDNVSPGSFFCNQFHDPRGSDIRLLGMVHDMTIEEIKLRFGHRSTRRCAALERACYESHSSRRTPLESLGASGSLASLLSPPEGDETGLFRVIEVWTFDISPSDPHLDPHWHCRFLLPTGRVIDETRSLLPSGSHPFAVKFYPLTDGKIHPFIEDLVGQQKHINTLITTIDQILANSAKGVLLMPVDAIPAGFDLAKVADIWSRPGGVIPIRPGAKSKPEEITAAGRSEGAARLLEIEMQLFQQISGVTAALQGQVSGSNMSASLYESQVYNSAIALLDVYESFNSFRELRDRIALESVNTILH